ncbi:PTS sugar transporter subunit IIA [Fusobacterium sp.]|uniref:PTS sugar transporter subunit IIA n=1 Tax=Fusobacterium sp. TaxID=68766 RepID=UPI0025C30DBA|nr:PTS sugar transporter subunit IIA [Fusobacterium sp.]
MYYDSLTLKLLRYINKSIEEVAEELKISERTIRYRIKDLNENFSSQKNFIYIEKKIIKFKGEISFLEKILEQEEYVFGSNERIEIILLLLLFNPEGYKAEKIITILNISRSTLKQDLKILRKELKEKNIEIISKANKGLIIVGEELEIRKLILEKLRNYFVVKNEKIELLEDLDLLKRKIIEDFLEKDLIERVAVFFKKIKIDLKKKISDEAFQIIFIYLLITLKRLREELRLEKCQNSQFIKSTEDYKVIQNNIALLEEKNIKINSEEIIKITEFILGAHTYNFQYSFYENWILIERFIDNLIGKMSKEIEINLNEDKVLREGLINHIVPTIYRLKNNLVLQESIAEEIRYEYPNYYMNIKKFVKEIENYIGKSFSDNEIAFLVVHFILALKRKEEKIRNHKRVVIVCGLGYGTSNLLKQEIEELFDIEVVDIVPLNNINNITELDVDYVLSTMEIKDEKISIPIIRVNAFLKKEDIIKLLSYGIKNKKIEIEVEEILEVIENYIDIKDRGTIKKKLLEYSSEKEKINSLVSKSLLELLPLKNIRLGVKIDSWQEAIEEAGEILLKNSYIDKEYIEEMKNKIVDLGTYMLIDEKVLLPHGDMERNVFKTGLSYVQLAEDIIFPGGLPVKHIFALCTMNSEEHIKGLLELKQLLEEKKLRIKLEKCLDKKEVLKIIEKNL